VKIARSCWRVRRRRLATVRARLMPRWFGRSRPWASPGWATSSGPSSNQLAKPRLPPTTCGARSGTWRRAPDTPSTACCRRTRMRSTFWDRMTAAPKSPPACGCSTFQFGSLCLASVPRLHLRTTCRFCWGGADAATGPSTRSLLILAYGRIYKEVTAVFAEAKSLGLATVLVTEAYDTPLARLADVVVAIPRGHPGQVSLHGATLVGLEAMVLSLAAAKPEDALASLDKLNHLRRAIDAPRKIKR
jgi:hypothetical protein